MRIGIFGGTFNPIHRGHLQIAQDVRKALDLDRIVFVPSGTPPHKRRGEVVPAHHRLEMVRLAVAPYPEFEVSTVEVDRKGPSYSVDTVRLLQHAEGGLAEWFFILGLDAFLDILSWKDPHRLFHLCHFVVTSRPDCHFVSLHRLHLPVRWSWADLEALDHCRQTQITYPLTEQTQLFLLKVTACPVRATWLREELRRGHLPKEWLPEAVQSYIMTHGLYRNGLRRGVIHRGRKERTHHSSGSSGQIPPGGAG